MPKLGFTDITTAAFWLLGTAKHLHSRWRLHQAKSWPVVSGAIEYAEGKLIQKAGTAVATAQVSYSYQVAGEWYAGQGSLEFADEDQVAEFTHRAKGRPIDVNVSPRTPADSAVAAEQARTWCEPEQSQAPPTGYVMPLAMRIVVYLVTLAAITGAAMSLYIQGAALAGVAVFDPDSMVGLIFSSFGLSFASVLVGLWLENVSARGRYRTPAWVRYVLYASWVYAGVNLFLAGFVETGHTPVSICRELSSFSILAFMSTFAQLYSAARTREPRAAEAGIWRQT
jgi:hypothetical protein